MGERDFQAEIFNRLGKLEQGQAALLSRLDERCAYRLAALDDLERRVGALEASEHRRRGGMAVMMALWAGAGAIGAGLAKFWPEGQ